MNHKRVCAWCGATFEAVRNDARTCSDRCRSQDRHQRNRAGLRVLDAVLGELA